MKTIYLDTSVLISPYHATDPYQTQSSEILTSRKITKTTSHIGLIELSATVSRLRAANQIQLPEEVETPLSQLAFDKQVYAILLFILRHGNVTVLVPDTTLTLTLENVRLNMSSTFIDAFKLAPKILLKTLDNLHVASLHSLLNDGHTIHYMVTGDEDLLRAGKEITELTNVTVISPTDIAKLEPL